MKKLLFLLFLSLQLQSFCSPEEPVAKGGILDLRKIENKDHFMLKLNGEWEFYWNRMLHPHDFESGKIIPEYFGKVPSYWADYPKWLKTENFGYATYRLRILLPEGFRSPLAFDLPIFDSSYDIYVNGKYIDGNGKTGKSKIESEPEYRKVFFRYAPESDIITVIINVSNYHHRRGGFWLPAKMGTFSLVQKHMANSWAANWSVISILLGCSLLFFFFFIFSNGEIMGFFSMISTGLALRPLFTNNFLIENFVNIPWIWLIRCEYIDLYFIVVGTSWFASKLYPSAFARAFAWGITITSGIAFLFTIFLPVRIFSYFMLVLYPALFIVTGYLIYRSFKAALKNSVVDTIYLMAFMLLLAGGLNDIWVALGRSGSGSGYLLTYMIVVIVIIQASLLIYRWIRSFRETEKLKLEMEFMNRNLEKLVDERTRELQIRNQEIEEQNKRIALQNKELSDTIQIKNRIFSVISHDLRSPVVNILYMLNLLKEKEYKEKYDTFANSSINYAQRVIGLLENMLVWGRGQEEKIKFSPDKQDLADLILTNLSIFKETADKKEISVNFTQVGSSIAWCDRDLLDIIIRNLLSNAVKYTPRKGRISIFLKDRKNSDNSIMLKICDNGIGMSDELQRQIFETEEVTSMPGTENEKGTGFGLKLCRELVKINNGKISVESRINEGTCFIIELPASNSVPDHISQLIPS